jgi:stress-induced morphogen
MGITDKQLEAVIVEKFQPTQVTVQDISGGCGSSFKVTIVSALFEGKSLLERHRLVYSILENEMKEIHALELGKTWTPTEWDKKMSK